MYNLTHLCAAITEDPTNIDTFSNKGRKNRLL